MSSELLNSILVIVGWIIVHQLSVYRDIEKNRREELVSALDKIMQRFNDLLVLSNEYHTNDRDRSREVTIKITLQDFQMQILHLMDICNPPHEDTIKLIIHDDFKLVRQAITLEHFEDEHLEPIGHDSNIIYQVANSIINLNSKLLELKATHVKFNYSSPALNMIKKYIRKA